MVTLTLRHFDGMPLKTLLRALMSAWRRVKQGGSVQRIWKKNVKASIRAVEVTYGENGWHPHLHVLLHTDGFSEDERKTLLERWKLTIERTLGKAFVPDDEHAIDWSTPIDMCRASSEARMAYPLKLGLEVAGPKQAKKGSLTPWALAEAAAKGDPRARALWLEFCRATKGRRMIELDDRAQRLAKTPRDLADEDGLREVEQERVTVHVDTIELRAIREYEQRFDPGILGVMIQDVSRSVRPEVTVRAWLDLVLHVLGYHARDGKTETEAGAGQESDAQGRQRAGPGRGS
jgi:replication protein